MGSETQLNCIPAAESDVEDLMILQYAACEGDPFHRSIWGEDTRENRLAAGARLLTKWRSSAGMNVVKCINVLTDKTMAFCVWEMMPAKSSREEALQEDSMTNCDWLQGHEREVARAYLIPTLEKRWEVMQGVPFAVLTNLCTHPASRHQGAAQALVLWGLQRADELIIPAYCEASEMGFKLYEKLGFQQVGGGQTYVDGELVEDYPVLLRQPQIKTES